MINNTKVMTQFHTRGENNLTDTNEMKINNLTFSKRNENVLKER